MPLFTMIGKDAADTADKRQAARPDHLAYWKQVNDEGRLNFAGPLMTEPGGKSIGSLIIFDAIDASDAQARVDGDPYCQAGVFGSIDLYPIKQVLPED